MSVENNHNHRHPVTSRRIIRSFKQKADDKRKPTERFADWMTSVFGTVTFLLLNAIWFVGWLLYNTFVPNPFDPFPFGLLTTAVSLEAIALSVIVLISQNRASKIADLREEVDLQVDVITEHEMTKVLELVAKIAEKNGISVKEDDTLQFMLKPTNIEKIEHMLEKQVVENGN